MAVGNVGFAARLEKETSATTQLKRFLSRYFYLCMSLARTTSYRSHATRLSVACLYSSSDGAGNKTQKLKIPSAVSSGSR
jgi:hypothetical protein